MEARFCHVCGAAWVGGASTCGVCGAARANLGPASITVPGQPAVPAEVPVPSPAVVSSVVEPTGVEPLPAVLPAAVPPLGEPPDAPLPAYTPPAFTQPAPPAPPVWTMPEATPAPAAGLYAYAAPVVEPAGPPPAEFAPAVWPGAPAAPVPAHRGRPRHLVAMIAAVVALIGVVAVGAFVWLVLLAPPSPSQMTQDLVTKMAARDATASTLLASNDSIRELAVRMGLGDLPGSVTVSVTNLKAGPPAASPGTPKSPAGDQPVTASYTLTWHGSKGLSGHVDQTLTAVARKGSDGKVHLVNFSVSGPIVFSLDSYFGTTGTSADDANKVADDLKAGTRWIPGMVVNVTPTDKEVTVPDANTPIPGHLATWSEVTMPAVPGNQRTWHVEVVAGTSPYATISAATAETKSPIAARVNVGALTESEAESQAAATDQAFWAAVDAGDVTKVNSMVSAGPKIDASALADMKGWGDGHSTAGNTATEASTAPEDKIGDETYVLGTDGSWGIDTSRSRLVEVVLGSTGSVYSLHGRSVDQGTGSVLCSTDITIKLSRVLFYTYGAAPDAVFSFVSTNNCDVNDQIISATAGWSGNSGGTELGPDGQGSDPGTTVERTLTLPGELEPSMRPVWIKITKYGDPYGGVLPDTMTFSTN